MCEGNVEGGLQYGLCIPKRKMLLVLVIEF